MIEIGTKKIGPGEPTYIIAEVGSNWATLGDCLDSVRYASLCGADAVKFQFFRPEELWGNVGKTPTTTLAGIQSDWLKPLKDQADSCKIEFLASSFSPEGAKVLDPFVKAHKLASSEMLYKELIDTLIALGKPVIVSTGGHSFVDVQKIYAYWAKRVPLLFNYCIADYPAETVNPFGIMELGRRIDCDIGFSDHSKDVYCAPIACIGIGAVLVEKHVNFTDMIAGPDIPHSLSMDDFKEMVRFIRTREMRLPPAGRDHNDALKFHNRRKIAIRDIPQGEEFKLGVNYGHYRSLKADINGLSPMNPIEGYDQSGAYMQKKAARAIKAWESIGPMECA